MIRKLVIENFRSIKELEMELTGFNALIGPNSSGKSNILKALNLIIGETYPSVRAFNEHDFCLHNKSKRISIEVHFNKALEVNDKVWGFKLTYDGDTLNYVALDDSGNVLCYPNSDREVKVSTKMREEVTLMYLPLDRQAHHQITPSQWKLYGKLLKHIASYIDEETKNKFKSAVEEVFDEKIFPYVENIERQLRNFVREQTGLDVALRLSLIDPTNILKDLRPRIKYPENFEVDVELEGAGVQSAVAIAMARVYAEVTNRPLVLAIEEPELYLHPHGCRHFYRLLKELSNSGVQVVYTTHERSFVRVEDYRSICIVRKKGLQTEVARVSSEVDDLSILKTASKFNEELNEIFFADKVVLTEGVNDKIACGFCLEWLGVDLDKSNVSIVDCGGIEEVKSLARILTNLGIETYALLDEDPNNAKTDRAIEEVKDILGDENVFLQTPNLEGIFNYSNGKFKQKKIRKFLSEYLEKNGVPQVYKELKNKIFPDN
ncbi:MAG: AAA family ATPase [Desulfurobacteriaceae bacterium]